jgi:hypothetical protein
MIQIAVAIILMLWFAMEAVNHYDGEVIIAPIKGLMVGALYNNDEGVDDTEYMVQLLFFIFSVNFIWIIKKK